MDNIENQSIYPQCNSYNPISKEPGSILKQRIKLLDHEIDFSNWKPKTMIDIGAGKNYMAHHFNDTLENIQSIEFLENMELTEKTKLFKNKFLDCVKLEPAEVVLGLRVLHYCYMETFTHYYLIKIAMLCKDKFLYESPTDLKACNKYDNLQGINEPMNKAMNEYIVRCFDGNEKGLFRMLNKFFYLEKRFKSDFANYEFLYLKRILPPKVIYPDVLRNYKNGDKWIKTGYPENKVMEFITVCQLLNQNNIINVVIDENHKIHGVIMNHIIKFGDQMHLIKDIYYKMIQYLLPIGYLPVDIVPPNVINGQLIDISCVKNIEYKFDEDPFINSILKNDIVLHHRQCYIYED